MGHPHPSKTLRGSPSPRTVKKSRLRRALPCRAGSFLTEGRHPIPSPQKGRQGRAVRWPRGQRAGRHRGAKRSGVTLTPPAETGVRKEDAHAQVPSRTGVTLTRIPEGGTPSPYLPFSEDSFPSCIQQVDKTQPDTPRNSSPTNNGREGEMCYGAQILRTTAKPQQVVTTRLLHCLQYQVPHLSRLQRIHPRAYLKLPSEVEPTRPFRQAGR